MKLLTKAIREKAEKQFKKGSSTSQMVVAKFFTPWTNWTWYLMNLDSDGDYAWGIVEGHSTEMGSFSIKELESIKGPLGLKIERDIYFTPIQADELWNKLKKQ